jgi:hypothetical protein
MLDVELPSTVYFHPKYAAPFEENLSFLASSGTEDAAVTAHKENGTASQQFKRLDKTDQLDKCTYTSVLCRFQIKGCN